MWKEFLALENKAPAFAIPLLLRFFSPLCPISSCDFLPVGELKLCRLSSSSPSSLTASRLSPPGIVPGPDAGFPAGCDAMGLSWCSFVGLLELPNILFKRPPPWVERLLLLLPARVMVLLGLGLTRRRLEKGCKTTPRHNAQRCRLRI